MLSICGRAGVEENQLRVGRIISDKHPCRASARGRVGVADAFHGDLDRDHLAQRTVPQIGAHAAIDCRKPADAGRRPVRGQVARGGDNQPS